MRIKIINPNTTLSMTEKIRVAAASVAGFGTEVVAVSPAKGPRSIETAYDEAQAVIGVLDEIIRGEEEGFDGYVIACFGDPGLFAAREVTRAPVIGIAQAAMHAASLIGEGFSIVSMPSHARAGMERLVRTYGMQAKCRRIRMLDMPVLDLEDASSRSYPVVLQACRTALKEDDADCVLLGCAGLSDAAAAISREIGAPAIDGVAPALKMVESLVALGLPGRAPS